MRRKAKTKQVEGHCTHIEFHDEQAQAIFIAGTFNEWSATATPMLALGAGRWVKALSLPAGRYEYCLVVDGEWICDPAAAEKVPNPFGGQNAVLTVSPAETQPTRAP